MDCGTFDYETLVYHHIRLLHDYYKLVRKQDREAIDGMECQIAQMDATITELVAKLDEKKKKD